MSTRHPDPADLALVERIAEQLRQSDSPKSVWSALDRAEQRTTVTVLLKTLEKQAPGRSVEVRVPPFAAVQCIAGPRHTRGTPSNTIELEPLTWVLLAIGALSWQQACAEQQVRVSGTRADLSGYLPL
jgi:hypothetical protein